MKHFCEFAALCFEISSISAMLFYPFRYNIREFASQMLLNIDTVWTFIKIVT